MQGLGDLLVAHAFGVVKHQRQPNSFGKIFQGSCQFRIGRGRGGLYGHALHANKAAVLTLDVVAGDDTYTFALPEKWIAPQGSSYVRIEFHEAEEPPKFYGLAYRDYKSARLISNPIWLKRKESTQC